MEKRIKILYIVSTLKRCGPTKQLYNIVSNLDTALYESKVLTLSEECNDSLKPMFDSAGIWVDSLKLSRVYGVFKGLNRLRKEVESYSPDIIHTQGIRADSYAVQLKDFKVKTVATIRCIPIEDYPMKYGSLLGAFMAKRHLKALGRLDRVVSVSRAINRSLLKLGLKTQTIQNGCDLSKYTPVSPGERRSIKEKLGVSQDKIILISVGHLSKRKDPLTVIRAFKTCNDSKRFELWFVGDGELRQDCVAEAGDAENIRFVGRVDNVDEFLQASDVFISASLSEGLPNTVLESLSTGVPTVLSEIPQHTEIFDDFLSSDRTMFFKKGDVNALKSILDNLELENIYNFPTREIVQKCFDARKMSERYQEIYNSIHSA